MFTVILDLQNIDGKEYAKTQKKSKEVVCY